MNELMTQTFNDWNPELYLKFNRERMQPAIDLVTRIDYKNPESIADIGCGPGNSTSILRQRWPYARITGVDNSPAMIERASHDYPEGEWILSDAGKDTLNRRFDIIFSNATIQWIPGHADLLKKFHGMLTDKGFLAVQIPLFWDMPIGRSVSLIATNPRWEARTRKVTEGFTIHTVEFYYEQLSQLFASVNIWVTYYMHIMESHQAIYDMMSSTGLRPYLEQMQNDQDRQDFSDMVFQSIERDYPLQGNGKVIYPFKRLFFTAGK
jgi:trans-aconitate 2-methyltransferase